DSRIAGSNQMLSIDRRVRENQFGYNTVEPRKIGASAPAPFRAADDLDRIRYGPLDSERIKTLTSEVRSKHRIFLLSPANLAGIRAGYVLRGSAESDLACRLRRGGVTLGELFSFISGLYFRGKLAYARAFSAPPPEVSGSFVITATAGLLAPETVVSLEGIRELTTNHIDADEPRYRAPLERDCRSLSEKLGDACDVVLLGSVATSKYVEPLLQIFGGRLLFPQEFIGRGDMSRGGLMLRAVEAGKELVYVPVLNATRHGPRPPKLLP